MKSVKQILKGHCGRKAVVYFLTWCLVLNTSLPAVLATPSGGAFAPGYTGTIEYGTNTAVTVNQAQSIIQWGAPGSGGIDTSSAESLSFSQAAGLSNSAVLNRIMSGNPTQFDGTLNGLDMRIFIVNQAGIVFGSGSHVNVTQLVASGLNMSDSDFLNATDGTPADFRFEFDPIKGGNGTVQNYRGTLSGESIILVGKKVKNVGSIMSPSGLVVMAAGDNVYLAQDGSSVLVEVAGAGDGLPDVENRSRITAENGGTIVLAAGDAFSRAVSNVGIITASSGTFTAQAAIVRNNGIIDVSARPGANADGGTIRLDGVDQALVGVDGLGTPGTVLANAGANGNGGSITLESEGTVMVGTGSLVSARGGSLTGDGGSVKITAEHFTLAGQVDASPANTDYEPGTLEIDPPTVTIANGANAGATDTLYEQDIETWGTKGTSLIVYADDGITVGDIADGRIAGRYGDIELYATGADSSVSFADTTDTISTTLGDIMMSAGSGGLTIGNLETGGVGLEETPGQIALSTHDGGNITTKNLTIRGGQGHAEINVDASGNLTANGNVMVGSELSPIHNVPSGQNAEAVVILKAGDNVVLNGEVGAYAEGIDDGIVEGDVTTAEIRIFAGTDFDEIGDATMNGNLRTNAQSSSEGTSEAIIEVEAWGDITFGGAANADAVADGAEAGPGTVDDEETSPEGDHAQIIITPQAVPPPVGIADAVSVSKDAGNIPVDVLANDLHAGDPFVIDSYTQPAAGTGTVTPVPAEGPTLSLEYHPPEDLIALTWDAEGHATVTFTYVAQAGEQLSEETTVTITLTNGLPVGVADTATTTRDIAVLINVLANDSDPDGDTLKVDQFGLPAHGTLSQTDGTFTYTPHEGYVGPDSFTYSATDSLNTTAVQTVTITVNPTVVPPPVPVPMVSPVAPGLERVAFEVSGCPALVKWAAQELGVSDRVVQIWIANALASTRDIQPCETCENLRRAATILQDADGVYTAALSKVVNEFASAVTPPTEEQMASIAEALARNAGGDNHYAVAGEYLDALVEYVDILTSEMGLSARESVQFVTNKYGNRVAQQGNAALTAYVAARLAALGG